MRSYASACCQAIQTRLKASIDCMKSSTTRNYSDLPVDFADFHSYCNSASLLSYRSAGYNGKSCAVGECGYPLAGTKRAAMEVQVAEDYV
jgi:hypothetical protein